LSQPRPERARGEHRSIQSETRESGYAIGTVAGLTGLDPLLVLALIRQESLFESLATSHAAAHGLMQVIPATGAQIAAELGWPPGYGTGDLYRPYVSLRFGTYYLAQQRDHSLRLAERVGADAELQGVVAR